MSEQYWIVPVLVKCSVDELDKLKTIIGHALEKHSYTYRHDIAKELNPEWLKAENSPIKFIEQSDFALIKVGPEPKIK